ncbi:hypothetical protein F511_03110 [Dorcoceras hygrometricum]|nr:hypothetical protein F511_03110 [Dorcoceras hygrometricum]
MSSPQDSIRSFLPFGNPLRMMLPIRSRMSPKLVSILNTFEETLAKRLEKLIPADKEEVKHISWMQYAIKSLFEIHTDVKALIAALQLPIRHCDHMWTDVYFDTSNKFLEICTALNNHISQLQDGHFFLNCAMVELNSGSFVEAYTSMVEWKQRVDAKNSRVDKGFSALDYHAHVLDRPNIKHSAKEKVLVQATYGVKAVALFLASTFAAAFLGSEKKLMEIQVPETYLWAENFAKLQSFMNTELRNIFSSGRVTVVNERESVDASVEKLFPVLRNGVDSVEAEVLETLKLELEKSSENFSLGLDLLAKELDDLFKDVIRGRNDLRDDIMIAFSTIDHSPANKHIG